MSSTYIWIISKSWLDFLIKRIVSTLPLEKPFSSKKLLNLSDQALGAYFNPYNALDNLNTWFEKPKISKLGDCST